MKPVARWFVFLSWWTMMIVVCSSIVWVPVLTLATDQQYAPVIVGAYAFVGLFFAAMWWTAE